MRLWYNCIEKDVIEIYSKIIKTPIGNLTIACNDTAVKGLWIEGQKYFGGVHCDELNELDKHPILDDIESWLRDYFQGKKPSPHALPLEPVGSKFRQQVWELLCDIPYGELVTYGELARSLGRANMSAQAVGGAVGHNPISIIIPCHRVIGANASLCGYAGGIHIKQQLLKHEGIDLGAFTIPK